MKSTEKKPLSRVLALDFGRAHTGLAISDPTGTVVRPLPDVDDAMTPGGLREIKMTVEREDVDLVVVGMPVSLKGLRGKQARETDRFVEELRTTLDIPVETCDERFTTTIAAARGRLSGASKHSLAACVLLEDYLRAKKKRG